MGKPSVKSTEFWITILGVVGGIVLSAVDESPMSGVIGIILATVCGGSYTIGRSMVKSRGEQGRMLGEAIADAAKKKSMREEGTKDS